MKSSKLRSVLVAVAFLALVTVVSWQQMRANRWMTEAATVLAREKEPVQRSDGKWMRLYLMADGSSRYIAAGAQNGFVAREKEFWP